MQQALKQITEKDGAIQADRPAGCPSGIQGSHWTGQVLDNPRAKLRALAEAMGAPCIVRDVDGDGYLLTLEPLQFIPLSHEDTLHDAQQ